MPTLSTAPATAIAAAQRLVVALGQTETKPIDRADAVAGTVTAAPSATVVTTLTTVALGLADAPSEIAAGDARRAAAATAPAAIVAAQPIVAVGRARLRSAAVGLARGATIDLHPDAIVGERRGLVAALATGSTGMNHHTQQRKRAHLSGQTILDQSGG